jgi:hypothetical protein
MPPSCPILLSVTGCWAFGSIAKIRTQLSILLTMGNRALFEECEGQYEYTLARQAQQLGHRRCRRHRWHSRPKRSAGGIVGTARAAHRPRLKQTRDKINREIGSREGRTGLGSQGGRPTCSSGSQLLRRLTYSVGCRWTRRGPSRSKCGRGSAVLKIGREQPDQERCAASKVFNPSIWSYGTVSKSAMQPCQIQIMACATR